MHLSKGRGTIIAIDGPDGVGKTTQVELLARSLNNEGYNVYSTRNSGGTPIGEALRTVSHASIDRPAETDVFISLAMGAALASDLQAKIFASDVIVIDRSPLAIVAYNGFGSRLKSIEKAYSACEQLFKDYGVDLLIYLDTNQTTVDKRRGQRGADDYFEKQNSSYHHRVRKGYQEGLKFLANHPSLKIRIVRIDAGDSIDNVHKQIIEAVRTQLK